MPDLIKIFGDVVALDEHTVPKVAIPKDLMGEYSKAEIEVIKQRCLEMYAKSKIALDSALAQVAVVDTNALEFANIMSVRVLMLMEIAVELGLVDKLDNKSLELINSVIPEDITKTDVSNKNKTVSQLKKDCLKTKLLSETGVQEGVEAGKVTAAGFVGFSRLAINNACNGNLRERMYIPFNSTHKFIRGLVSKSDNVDKINQELLSRGLDWSLNSSVIDYFLEQSKGRRGGVFAYGTYAHSREGSRVENVENVKAQIIASNPTVEALRQTKMPLSAREQLTQSGDIDNNNDAKVNWVSGEALYHVDKNHLTAKAADSTGDLMLTGISGTTDSILTLGHIIGMFDKDDRKTRMQDGLVACIGWLVDARAHSAHEVLSSGKTFGLSYNAAPNSYLQIRPGDNNFLDNLQKAQARKGFKMPEAYLTKEYFSHQLALSKKHKIIDPMLCPKIAHQRLLKKTLLNIKESFTIRSDDDYSSRPTL